MRSLKRATIFLTLLSFLLLLFISNTTLECDHREYQTGGALRVGDQSTPHGERNQVMSGTCVHTVASSCILMVFHILLQMWR